MHTPSSGPLRPQESRDGPMVCKYLLHGIPGFSKVSTKVEFGGRTGGWSTKRRQLARRCTSDDGDEDESEEEEEETAAGDASDKRARAKRKKRVHEPTSRQVRYVGRGAALLCASTVQSSACYVPCCRACA
jgi:hypothetical protein